MSRGLIGRKVGMTGVFNSEGAYVPVTVLEVGPCVVTQIKTKARDGYNALQLAFDKLDGRRLNKPARGHFQKNGLDPHRVLREFRTDDPADYQIGQRMAVDLFKVGDKVDVVGRTKGRGFAGVIKRHGFHGGKKTHGSHSHRIPGSIGCSAWPAKVIKGKKLPGRYGYARQTARNLEIVEIRADQNLMLVKGAVPGSKSGLVSVVKPKFAD
jgi:large subunit ribosomal protein L3